MKLRNWLKRRQPRWLQNFGRDLRVFGHLFPWRVTLILLAALVLTSYLYWVAVKNWEGVTLSPLKAFFAVINMTFFQLTFADMPVDARLDIFPVLVPLIGLPLFSFFGLKVIGVIRVFFLRGERGQEWQAALVESTITNHIVVCGLGRIGYRVARSLAVDYQQTVVGINDTPSVLVDTLLGQGLPVILGDVQNMDVLHKAGIERASVIIICTNQDWVNLETMVRVRRLNRRARIVLRLFEDELVEDLLANFEVNAIISRSAVAALSFTYAAVGGKIIETFELGDQKSYVLAQVPIDPTSPLLGRSVGQVADEQDVTVVCHNRGAALTVEPPPNTRLAAGDNLFIFTTVEQMLNLIEYKKRHATGPQQRGPILVCGLGHTGYRVVTNLHDLGFEVVAMDYEPNRLAPRLQELGISLKYGDLRWGSLLLEAGAAQATAIVTCTDDDMMNLQIALRARKINPQVRVVMRIFDDELSEQLRHTFGLNAAYSTSALASPDFVSAALNQMNVRRVDIAQVPQVVVRLHVRLSSLLDVPIIELNEEEGLTVLLHARNGQVEIPPRGDARLKAGDEIVVLATEAKLSDLNRRNKSSGQLLAEGYGVGQT